MMPKTCKDFEVNNLYMAFGCQGKNYSPRSENNTLPDSKGLAALAVGKFNVIVGAHGVMSLLSTLNHAVFRGWISDSSLL